MTDPFKDIAQALKPVPVVYCDWIARVIADALLGAFAQIVTSVSPPQSDLHPTEGYLRSTRKTISATDFNGKRYRITIEEVTE